jgi:hypothetical protein
VKVLLALTAGVAAALVPAAASPARPRTTAPPEVVAVKITISDTAVHMSPKRAQRGAVARFILVNVGKKPHTFALGHLRRGTGSQTGFTKSLRPNEQSILVLFLDYRGALPYRCTLPADRTRPGMRGIFTII